MANRFDYILEKIQNSNFLEEPFKHIYIESFFDNKDFDSIIKQKEINLEGKDDKDLIENLLRNGYKIVPFPGTFAGKAEYLKWRKNPNSVNIDPTTEGSGIVFRLIKTNSQILKELQLFISSERFTNVLKEKFNLEDILLSKDFGIQKYLDGYEISPHPDTRKKALTYMININPLLNSDKQNHHTHYLKFKKEREYVYKFWEGNLTFERAFCPWDWCEIIKTQNKNNSIVIFSPSNYTLHGVKANYLHLNGQRTQIYGNLWYENSGCKSVREWNDLDIINPGQKFSQVSMRRKFTSYIINKIDKFKSSKLIDDTRRSHYENKN